MEQQITGRSLRERVSISVQPVDPATLVETLVESEEAGVDHAWVAFGPLGYPDILTTLAAAAIRTSHLKLGTAIVQVTSRHPVLMAQQILSLAGLAPGRLKLGVGGTGLPQMVKSYYGVEMASPLAYLREYIQVLRPLLQQGEVHHRGRYFTVDATLQGSAPVPLLISALGAEAFQLAGEVADGALPFMTPIPYLLNTALPALSVGAAAAARPRPPVVAHVPVAFTEDRTTALQAGRLALGIYPTLPAYRKMYLAGGFTEQDLHPVSERLVESLLVSGSEARIRDRVLELLETPIDALALSLVPVSDATQERVRLARLVGRL